jgi:hypothetical protein
LLDIYRGAFTVARRALFEINVWSDRSFTEEEEVKNVVTT